MTDQLSCALWYWRHFAVTYEIFDGYAKYTAEQEAAQFAVHLEDVGSGVPIGVQFSDGRTIWVNDWTAYREAMEQRDEREETEKREYVPPEMRTIFDPFRGKSLSVEVDEPAWLGRIDAPLLRSSECLLADQIPVPSWEAFEAASEQAARDAESKE